MTFTSALIILFFLVVVGQLASIGYYLRRIYRLLHHVEFDLNPLFPVFSRERVFDAKQEVDIAQRRYDEANQTFEDSTLKDDKIEKEFQETSRQLDYRRETLHRLIEANISALNGKKISQIRDEHSDWLMKSWMTSK